MKHHNAARHEDHEKIAFLDNYDYNHYNYDYPGTCEP